jgi:hypothetical protein
MFVHHVSSSHFFLIGQFGHLTDLITSQHVSQNVPIFSHVAPSKVVDEFPCHHFVQFDKSS